VWKRACRHHRTVRRITTVAATELVAGYLHRRPPEARGHVVGDDLDLGATFAILVLPGTLVEPPVDHDT